MFSPGVTDAKLRLTMDLLTSAHDVIADLCAGAGALPLRDLAARFELKHAVDLDINETD